MDIVQASKVPVECDAAYSIISRFYCTRLAAVDLCPLKNGGSCASCDGAVTTILLAGKKAVKPAALITWMAKSEAARVCDGAADTRAVVSRNSIPSTESFAELFLATLDA
jgi:hypothetical protein